jgi:type I restriction enzyme, S subunit
MKWPEVPLSKVAVINPGRPRNLGIRDDQPVSFVPMPAVSEQSAAIEHPDMCSYVDVKKGFTYFEENDILFAKITPCMENGKSAVATGLVDGIGFGSTEFHVIRPNQSLLLPKYVHYFVRQQSFRDNAKARMRGAVGPQRVPKEFLDDTMIPLPSISEQRRIVEILDQADRLRKLRAKADAKAQGILRALFIKMFGDPATNPKGWPIAPLAELGDLDRGRSRHRPRNAPELLGGPYPFIQTGDVAKSQGYIRMYSSTYSELGFAQSKIWPAGTLCITIAANIAASAILGFDACFPDSVVGFTPYSNINSAYVRIFLSFLRPILERSAPQVAQKNINLKILRDLPTPVPPKNLLDSFKFQHDKMLFSDEIRLKSGRNLDRLWRALIHRAFTGDLTCKWQESHMKELMHEREKQNKLLSLDKN